MELIQFSFGIGSKTFLLICANIKLLN